MFYKMAFPKIIETGKPHHHGYGTSQYAHLTKIDNRHTSTLNKLCARR